MILCWVILHRMTMYWMKMYWVAMFLMTNVLSKVTYVMKDLYFCQSLLDIKTWPCIFFMWLQNDLSLVLLNVIAWAILILLKKMMGKVSSDSILWHCITYAQVLQIDDVPKPEEWMCSAQPLCPVVVHTGSALSSSDSSSAETVQVRTVENY